MIMDIVNVGTVGHCDHNVSNEHIALYAEIQTLREQLANGKRLLLEQMELTNERTKLCIELRTKVEVLVEALRKVQKNLKRPIKTVNGSVTISFTFVDEALATYDKLSEVKHDTK